MLYSSAAKCFGAPEASTHDHDGHLPPTPSPNRKYELLKIAYHNKFEFPVTCLSILKTVEGLKLNNFI